jgi:hypothetical protein
MTNPRVAVRFSENALEKAIRQVALLAHGADNNATSARRRTAYPQEGLWWIGCARLFSTCKDRQLTVLGLPEKGCWLDGARELLIPKALKARRTSIG